MVGRRFRQFEEPSQLDEEVAREWNFAPREVCATLVQLVADVPATSPTLLTSGMKIHIWTAVRVAVGSDGEHELLFGFFTQSAILPDYCCIRGLPNTLS